MSKDDYHVVLYKVLSYFYECLKAGASPILEKAQELAAIDPTYWRNALQMALDSGYIAGIERSRYKGARPEEQVWLGSPRITEKGIEYLMENSLMAKAKTLLGEAWTLIVETAVAVTKGLL